MKTISHEEIKQNLDAGRDMKIVEALPEKDFTQGHLPGALNIPPDQVHELAPKLLPEKGERIVVYCASSSCDASEEAADTLEGMGYTNVERYVEGKEDWKNAGLPLENGTVKSEGTKGDSCTIC